MANMTEDRWAELLREYASSDLAVKDLVEKYGLKSNAQIYKKLQAAGIERRYKGPRKVDVSEFTRLSKSGKTMEELAEHFGYKSSASFWGRLKKLGMAEIHTANISEKWKQTWDAAAADYAAEILTVEEVLEKHQVSRVGLWQELQRRNIPTTRGSRRHFFNEKIFENPTPELAYQMGFGLADGAVCQDHSGTWSYQLQIGEKDRCVIENLIEVFEVHSIGGSQPISRTGGHWKTFGKEGTLRWCKPRVKVRLHHKKFAEWLEPWGIVPNKTYNYCEPQVPSHLLPAFLLGFFDGDGWVSNARRSAFNVGVCGSFEILGWVQGKMRELGYCGKFRLFEKNDWWGRLSFGGGREELVPLAYKIGADKQFCLQRKWPKILAAASTTHN